MLLREHKKGKQAEAVMRGELKVLDLAFCWIRADGAELVADFLRFNDTVVEVSLFCCYIELPGVMAIFDALKNNKTVEILNLQANAVGHEGKALIGTLDCNVSIRVLYIIEEHIDPEPFAIIKYRIETRNAILIPAAVRRASLYLIASRRTVANAGVLGRCPKEIVKMIAMEVWATRKDSDWIQAFPDVENLVPKMEIAKKLRSLWPMSGRCGQVSVLIVIVILAIAVSNVKVLYPLLNSKWIE